MSTPATVRGKNDGEVRPYEPSTSLFFAQWPIRLPITRHCYSSGRRRPPETTGTVDFGSNPLAIWGIPVKKLPAVNSSTVDWFVWRVFVPLLFALCIILTIGGAFDRDRLLIPDGFTTDSASVGLADSEPVTAVVPGSAAERAGLRAGDVVRFDGLSPGKRVLSQVGERRHLVDLRTGHGLTFTLRTDPINWTVSKHFFFAAVIALELAAFAILLLRPNLLVAQGLAAAVILSSFGTFGGLGHWTGNEAVGIATSVLRRCASSTGIASLGVVALGLSASIGPKRRALAYATIALGTLTAVIAFVYEAVYIATGYESVLGLPLLSRTFSFLTLLGFISVASIALQARGLERRRAVIVATALLFGNLSWFGQALHPHFISGAEQVVDTVAVLLEAVGLAYAILVDQLFDIGFVLNRAVVIGTVTALVLPAFVAVEWAAQRVAESSGRFEGAALSLASTIAIAFSVRPLHRWVDRVIDTVLFAARHRAANAVRRFAEEVALFREPSALVTALLDTLVTFTRVDRCEVLLADEDDDLVMADSRALSVAGISSDDAVAVRLKSSRSWLERATFPLLTQADLAFPMVVRGRLIGALLCTLPARAEPLSPEEFDAIAHLMREAGATLVAMDAADAHRLREENLALQARLALHT